MATKSPDLSDHPFVKFLLAALPGWLIGVAVAVVLYRTTDLPRWVALAAVGLWIVSDIVTFPRQRRYYTSEPAAQRMIGKRGVAASTLAPRGLVRVRGELWHAETTNPGVTIHEGQRLRVRETRGLNLIVEPLP